MIFWIFCFIAGNFFSKTHTFTTFSNQILQTFGLTFFAVGLYFSRNICNKKYIFYILSGFLWGYSQSGSTPSIICQLFSFLDFTLSTKLNNFILIKINRLPDSVKAWLESLLLGKPENYELKKTFRFLGLYHILVVSGLHISVAAHFIKFLFQAPITIFYSLRLFSCSFFSVFLFYIDLLAASSLWVYAAATGLGQASQRAALIFTTTCLSKHMWGAFPFRKKIYAALTMQAVIFPNNFCSTATLMSWSAYLIVIICLKGSQKKAATLSALNSNLILLLLTGAIFAELSLFGFLFNFLIIPCMPVIFTSAVLLVIIENFSPTLEKILINFHESFLFFLSMCQKKLEMYWFSYFSIHEFPLLRLAFLFFVIFLVFNFYLKETIINKTRSFINKAFL